MSSGDAAWWVTPNLSVTPSRWSGCRGSVQTRWITLCDTREGCLNITRIGPRSDIFRLSRRCDLRDGEGAPVAALVFVGLVLSCIVFGCMWRCGCFQRRASASVRP